VWLSALRRSHNAGFHENLQEDPLHLPSEKTFGLTFAAFFVLLGLYPLIHHRAVRLWAFVISALLLLIAVASPSVLKYPNVLWAKFGLLLSRITNPIVTSLMFFGFFTPIALVLRAIGRDPLRLKFDGTATTYWVARVPAGPEPESMRHQF
jgi:Saxitoxin biosynthesis operon protein SxtJ